MSETYAQAIKAARERYKEAMDGAAADALVIVEQHGKPMTTVCKDIAGDEWNALRRRAHRLETTAGQTPDERARRRAKERARIQRVEAKSALSDPDQRAALLKTLPEETKVEMRRTLLTEAAEPSPRVETPQFDPWLAAQADMAMIDRRMGELADHIGKSRMTDHRQAALDEWTTGLTSSAQQLRTDKGRAALSIVKEA